MIVIDLIEAENKLPSESQIKLNEVIKYIFKSKKATVLTGAGISCNAGIPDFRSSNGLYEMVKSKYPKAVVKGQDLFDVSLFRDEMTLSLFCTFMESLYQSSLQAKPTETHKFIKLLKDKNKLLRCYTQNIDSLESSINLNMGINLSKFDSNSNFSKIWRSLDVVQLHGNLHKLSCTQCFSNYDWNKNYQTQLSNGMNPQCNNCHAKYIERLYLGKRITGNGGLLRPDVVLYGENHPQSEILSQGLNLDLKLKPDLLIIMGTSLKVDGVKKLAKSLCNTIHNRGGKVIFINKTPVSKQWENFIDYEILSDCDNFIKILRHEIPDLFLTQEQLDSKKLKNNKQKTIKKEVHTETLTAPDTPKKKKPYLKRKPLKQVKQPIKCELPTPLSSFTEDHDHIDDTAEPLRDVHNSKLNVGRPKRIKLEGDGLEMLLPKRAKV
ncbi:uncharacterized protein PRCAT00005979001 [Priceomyces carsonii]|uniref:uncharacterized protein n=1 Tax=Priceomyces carsonii TaxID=28549 RepID=UPI002ED8C8FE|nr:unnamed protein product [Priceomyces carsonii]